MVMNRTNNRCKSKRRFNKMIMQIMPEEMVKILVVMEMEMILRMSN